MNLYEVIVNLTWIKSRHNYRRLLCYGLDQCEYVTIICMVKFVTIVCERLDFCACYWRIDFRFSQRLSQLRFAFGRINRCISVTIVCEWLDFCVCSWKMDFRFSLRLSQLRWEMVSVENLKSNYSRKNIKINLSQTIVTYFTIQTIVRYLI